MKLSDACQKEQFLEVFRLLCQLHSKTNSCVFEAIGIIFAINQHTFFCQVLLFLPTLYQNETQYLKR